MNGHINRAHSGAHAARRLLLVSGAGVFATALAFPALAYVGPGAGLGIFGALLALIIATLATVVGLILWPLRIVTRRWKMKRRAAEGPQSGEGPH